MRLEGLVTDDRSSVLVFFFSSRRRHTRSKRDWSSDVCSSDLVLLFYTDGVTEAEAPNGEFFGDDRLRALLTEHAECEPTEIRDAILARVRAFAQIGRASCRERV